MRSLFILLLYLALISCQESNNTCIGSPCPSGKACSRQGFCADICRYHEDCNNPNFYCDGQTTPNTCHPKSCSNDLDCIGPSLCGTWAGNVCTVPDGVCTSNYGCDWENGQVCDIQTGKCHDSCHTDTDCSGGKVCDVRGRCSQPLVHCWSDSDCNSEQVCNTVKQQCVGKSTICLKWTDCFYPGGTYCHIFQFHCRLPCTSHQDCWYPNTICNYEGAVATCVPKACSGDHDCQSVNGTSLCRSGTCTRQLIPCQHDPQQLCIPFPIPPYWYPS